MTKETKTTTEVITHTIDYAVDQYWEIDYSYRNGKLTDISIFFRRKTGGFNSLSLANWNVDGNIKHVLALLVYYFKTKKFENMFPNTRFTHPRENDEEGKK